MGDKGYISSGIYKFKKKDINLVTYKRSNQKKQNTHEDKDLLKNRGVSGLNVVQTSHPRST